MSEMNHRYRITLLRHALSVANETRVVQGQQDSPLSATGRVQAQELAQYWHDAGRTFDRIISSPLTRAKMTTKIITQLIPADVEYSEQWMERRYGVAEGMKYEEYRKLLRSEPKPSPYENIFETGESEWDLFLRASAAIQDLLDQPPGEVLVVSHGGILNASLHSILGVSPSSPSLRIRFAFENTGHAKIQYDRNTQIWWILYLNDHKHLDHKPQDQPRSAE